MKKHLFGTILRYREKYTIPGIVLRQDIDSSKVGWVSSKTWVWVNSGSWWWTGRPGVLRFMGSQRVGHNWATELNWSGMKFRQVSISYRELSVKSRNHHCIQLSSQFLLFCCWCLFCFWPPHPACGILVPWPGTNTWPLHWKCEVLHSRPPWKSQWSILRLTVIGLADIELNLG